MNQLLKQSAPFLTTLIFVLVLFVVPGFAWAKVSGTAEFVWEIVTMVFGTFVALAGKLLDFSVNDLVIGFGEIYLTDGIGFAIDNIWVNVRDIFNITFIFGLIYIGFKMILDSSNSNTQRWLINLIMAALLVNFSLFFTKIVIDVSNTIATEIVQSGFENKDISVYFADELGFGGMLGYNNADLEKLVTKDADPWGYIVGSMIMMIVMTFVFASGAMLLIIRFAVLLFYMILSPFMFIGWVFPQLQKYTTQYWSGFLGRAFFAPLYLLFVYLSAQIIRQYFLNLGDPNYSATFNTTGGEDLSASFTATLPPFIIACIFLIMSLIVANKLGANGASAAIGAGKSMSRKFRGSVQRGAGNITFGAGASVGRNMVGRGANALVNNDKWKKRSVNSFVGKKMYDAASGVAGSSFDARRVGGVGKTLGIGEGQKGGYAKQVKDRNAAEKKFAKDLGTVDIYNDNGTIKDEYSEQLAHEVNNDEGFNSALTQHSTAKTNLDSKKAELETKKRENQFGGAAAGQLDAEVKALEEEVEEAKRTEGKAKKAVEKAKVAAQTIAESKAKYARQLDYIKQLESSAKTWGGTATNILTLGASGAHSGRSSSAAKDLTNEYGKDGTKAMKKDGQVKQFKLMAEVQKASGYTEDAAPTTNSEVTDNPTTS